MLAEYNGKSLSTIRMNSVRQIRTSERGFTLVELMVTVAIMGVVVAFAVPNMTRQIAESRMRTTASTFESALKEAKAESLIRRKDVTMEYSGAGTLILSVGSGTNKKQLAKYSIDDKSVVTPVTNVLFKPSKTIQGNAVTYKICDDVIGSESSINVTVDKNSNISVARGDVC